jgi:hypothetical protein
MAAREPESVRAEVERRLSRPSSEDEARESRRRFLDKLFLNSASWLAYLAVKYWLYPREMSSVWLVVLLGGITMAMLTTAAWEYGALVARQTRRLSAQEIRDAAGHLAPCNACEAVFARAAWVCPECGAFRRPALVTGFLFALPVALVAVAWLWMRPS